MLEKVVPWGRSFEEYCAMFALTQNDLAKRILGVGDGPASFNAELTRRGGKVVSADPLYQFSAEEIKRRIEDTYDKVISEVEKNQEAFVWKNIKSVEDLGNIRMAAMEKFLADYPNENERYQNAKLPNLPFADKSFELALCSHFLFLYSPHHDFEFHLESVAELCRVAHEVRIFPLVAFSNARSHHLDGVLHALQESSFHCKIEPVAYEFQKGGNEMLRIQTV
ncbi:SAM-dependent methyltransferase [Chloroherpeton thalassium]|nr:SAM-dependent methyltransferase [Chloroherpeton thalassium]